jgi:hypothetical protein
MSKNRYINTDFWTDPYVFEKLDPTEKLLFLYILTNDKARISGVYEISLKKIAVETGIDKEMIIKIFDRFYKDEKMQYYNSWVIITNMAKQQNHNNNIIKGIKEQIKDLPEVIKKTEGFQRLSKALRSHINIDIDINISNKEIKSIKEIPKDDYSAIIANRYFTLHNHTLNFEQREEIETAIYKDEKLDAEKCFEIFKEALKRWALQRGSSKFTFTYLMGTFTGIRKEELKPKKVEKKWQPENKKDLGTIKKGSMIAELNKAKEQQ